MNGPANNSHQLPECLLAYHMVSPCIDKASFLLSLCFRCAWHVLLKIYCTLLDFKVLDLTVFATLHKPESQGREGTCTAVSDTTLCANSMQCNYLHCV